MRVPELQAARGMGDNVVSDFPGHFNDRDHSLLIGVGKNSSRKN